ncbi:FAD-dependent oxidoreductase [Gloeocapsopsis dulcis]|nr:FAD-dependent oxidoreductase [Gloeocapsopsis dulcis]WNN89555.1 FAD-dependent oxidoreductase [Gloeocapsopsis dulcis]
MQIQSWGRGFHLTFSRNYEVDTDYVIIAIPFTVLRDIKIRVGLPKQLRRFINEVNLGANEKIYARFNQKVWQRDKGVCEGSLDRSWIFRSLGCNAVTGRQKRWSAYFLLRWERSDSNAIW